jgi:hypothetical protein
MLVSAGLDSLLAAFVPEEVNPRAQAREVACSLHVMVTQTGELHFAVACVLCRANLEVLAALASPVDSLEVCCGCLVCGVQEEIAVLVCVRMLNAVLAVSVVSTL